MQCCDMSSEFNSSMSRQHIYNIYIHIYEGGYGSRLQPREDADSFSTASLWCGGSSAGGNTTITVHRELETKKENYRNTPRNTK